MYKNSSRCDSFADNETNKNFIFFCNLKTDRDPNYWVKKGVALSCLL